MPVCVVGAGATGTAAARVLRGLRPDLPITLVDRNGQRAARTAHTLGPGVGVAESLLDVDAPTTVLLCVAAGAHRTLAETALRLGAHVVSVGDAIGDVTGLCALDAMARAVGRAVVVGAGFSPGLSCVLARHAAALFDEVDEILVSKSGTGGPDCARQHHRSLTGHSWEWRDGQWLRLRGSSGRRLAWFPDPIGALDCYHAALPEPLLLRRGFEQARRVSARVAATRRDRSTSWLPMLRRPHADGGPGGLRVEVWGRRDGVADVVIYGAVAGPAPAAGAMAAVVTAALEGAALMRTGAYGLAEAGEPTELLATLADLGIGVATFEGAT